MKVDELKEILKPHLKKLAKIEVLSDGSLDQCVLLGINYIMRKLDDLKVALLKEYNLDLYYYTAGSETTILCFDMSKPKS